MPTVAGDDLAVYGVITKLTGAVPSFLPMMVLTLPLNPQAHSRALAVSRSVSATVPFVVSDSADIDNVQLRPDK